MHLDHPFHVDGHERTARTTESDHVRDMIELILFTESGERVMRPDFGAGVRQLAFGPLSPETAAAATFMIQGALQQYLGNRITVHDVAAEADDAALRIRVSFRLQRTGEDATATFVHEVGA